MQTDENAVEQNDETKSAQTDNAPAPEAAIPETTESESEATKEAEPPPKPKNETPAWAARRFASLTREKHEAQRERDLLKAEVEIYRQSSGQVQPLQPQNAQGDVETRAQQLVAEREFNDACNDVYDKGMTAYPDFQDAINTYGMLGGLKRELIEASLATDNPAKVLYELAKDPDQAEKIMAMTPAKMGVAIAKLERAPAKVASVSKAPAPIKPIEGSTKAEADPSKMSMTEWVKWREKQIAG